MKYSSYSCQGAAQILSPRQISISFLTLTLFLGAKHVQKAHKTTKNTTDYHSPPLPLKGHSVIRSHLEMKQEARMPENKQ